MLQKESAFNSFPKGFPAFPLPLPALPLLPHWSWGLDKLELQEQVKRICYVNPNKEPKIIVAGQSQCAYTNQTQLRAILER